MNKPFKLTGLIAAMGLLCLASASASAGIISFSFFNNGSLNSSGDCGANCLLLDSTGTATEIGGLPGLNEWSFHGSMKVYEGDLGFGVGPGLGWSFTDLDGNNNLSGTFTAAGDLLSWLGSSEVHYTVLGGSGLFSGAIGEGTSTIWTSVIGDLDGFFDSFWEIGSMTVWTPSTAAVPEPGVSALLIAGLGMIGFMAYRRRRATTQL